MTTDRLGTDSTAPADPQPGTRRVRGLDWARGWMLIASVGVNSLIAPAAWFNHAVWASVHPIDVIFPIFVTLSGCGLAFALHRRVRPGPLLRRFVVLMLAGLAYNAVVTLSFDPATWRLTGVLQLYAVLVAVISLLHLVTRTWVGWAIITVVLAVGQSLMLGLYAQGCPAHVLTRECNPSGPLDSLLLGANHIYALGAAGHDPEGIVAILGALISASAGATIGHVILAARRRPIAATIGPRAAAGPLLGLAAGMLLLTAVLSATLPIALGFELPAMKRLWTAPFALPIGAGVAVLLLVGHLLLDRPGVGPLLMKTSSPLIALGRNSLLVYFGSHVLMSLLDRPLGDGPSIAERVANRLDGIIPGQVVWTLLLLAFWTLLAVLLDRRKIYLRP